jgi:Flp pilus assembly CpaE family ATPase
VRLLAAAQSLDDGDAVTPQALERIVHLSRAVFPWTVLDIDFRRGRNPALLRAARIILLVFRLDFGSLCNARRLVDYWEQHHVDLDRVVLVANRYGQASEIPARQVPSLLGKPIAFSIPEDVSTANLALNCGNPAILEAPRSSLSRAIAAISDQLLGASAGKAPDTRDNGLLQRAAGILFC